MVGATHSGTTESSWPRQVELLLRRQESERKYQTEVSYFDQWSQLFIVCEGEQQQQQQQKTTQQQLATHYRTKIVDISELNKRKPSLFIV